MMPERMKFLVILNALRRDAKQINIESEIFDTYRYNVGICVVWL